MSDLITNVIVAPPFTGGELFRRQYLPAGRQECRRYKSDLKLKALALARHSLKENLYGTGENG